MVEFTRKTIWDWSFLCRNCITNSVSWIDRRCKSQRSPGKQNQYNYYTGILFYVLYYLWHILYIVWYCVSLLYTRTYIYIKLTDATVELASPTLAGQVIRLETQGRVDTAAQIQDSPEAKFPLPRGPSLFLLRPWTDWMRSICVTEGNLL